MSDEARKLGQLLCMGTEDIFIPGHMVPVFNLGNAANAKWTYIRDMCSLLVFRDVCAILVYGLTDTEALIMEAMNDGMCWTTRVNGISANLYCTNYMPEEAVPLLFKTAGVDPIRYPITDAKRRA